MGDMTMRVFLLVILVGCVPWVVSPAADDVQAFVQDGRHVLEPRHLGPTRPARLEGDGGLVWHNYYEEALVQSVSIAASASRLIAGTWLNPPLDAELIPLEGDGTADWAFPGTNFRVGASRNGGVLVGVDKLANSVTLYKWHSGSSTPDWSFPIPSATVGGVRCVVVSPDASTIALVVTMLRPQRVRLYCFDADSPVPIATFDANEGTSGGNIDITADGRFIAFYALADAFVYDRDTQSVRWTGYMGGGNDPLAISGDGEYIAYGWMSLYVRRWNGSTYEALWSEPGGNFWVKTCRFSNEGSTLVVGWCDHDSYLQNRIELFEMPDRTPLWTYLYRRGSGEYQDIPREIAITNDGSYIAVGSWGDEANTNPEVHVFEHDAPAPILTLDTPGSVFDIDIAEVERGTVYVAASGKHIHANENGRGGDLYSLRVEHAAGVVSPPSPGAEVSPNPFTRATTISWRHPGGEHAELGIYTPAGRLIRRLHGEGDRLNWDGCSRSGVPVEPGVYYLRLRVAGRTINRRAVRLER